MQITCVLLDPCRGSLPWCIQDQERCAVGNWNIQGVRALTLLYKDISKLCENVINSYMKGKQAELCSLIQSPEHLLIIENCLMDVCLE